jgi:hypothetical protein
MGFRVAQQLTINADVMLPIIWYGSMAYLLAMHLNKILEVIISTGIS